MANGTSTSHARLTIAEILESPGRHEAYLAEVAAWAHDRIGGPAPEPGRPAAPCPCVPAAIHRNTITITGNTEPAPTRWQVTGALLDEAGWLAERLTAARAAERAWIAHMLVFTGLGRETAVLSEVRSELRPRLLRQGIVIGEFHRASLSAGARNRNCTAGLSPWPCFALRAFNPQRD
jgi:hypothetical protein